MSNPFESPKFYRSGAEIETPGVDFSGRIRSIHRNGVYEVWRKAGASAWSGNGGVPRKYVPTCYWLVKIESEGTRLKYGRARFLEEVEPGRDRTVKDRLIEKCDRLAVDPLEGGAG